MAVAEEIQEGTPEDNSRLEGAGSSSDYGVVGEMYMPQAFGGPGSPRGVYSPRDNLGNSIDINAQAVRDAEDRLKEKQNPRRQVGFLAISNRDWTA